MDRRLTKEALRLMEAHQPFVRTSVVDVHGSAPGKLGASMLMRADGSTVGTVGGAALDERVKQLARSALDSRHGGLHRFDLANWRPGGLPSLCGGVVDVSVEFVPARPNLLLWGGGHVAAAIAPLLAPLEYDYSVADDRPEWVDPERFPGAVRREVVAPNAVWERFVPEEFTHLYLLGYDAAKDTELLAASVERFPGFVGLIASAAKRAHIFAALRSRGVPASALARVRSPIGLTIGAETPAEIAVAVVAEIIRAQHPLERAAPVGRTSRRLRGSRAPAATPR